MKRPALPVLVHEGRYRLVYSDGTILPRVCGAEDDPAAQAAAAAAATAAAAASAAATGPKGGDEALRADLARERDKRQAAETKLNEHLASQSQADHDKRTADAVAAAVAAAADAHTAQDAARIAPVLARLVITSARKAAEDAGVVPDSKPEGAPETWAGRVDRFLNLVDLKGLASEDGDVDTKVLGERISAAAQANPEFVTKPQGRAAAPGGSQGGALKPPSVSVAEATDEALTQMLSTLRRPKESAAT